MQYSAHVLSGKLYAKRFQKLISLYTFTNFHEDFSSIVGFGLNIFYW